VIDRWAQGIPTGAGLLAEGVTMAVTAVTSRKPKRVPCGSANGIRGLKRYDWVM